MSEVWLIRHAQSMNNALGEDQRQPDPPLTDLGQRQARALADGLHRQLPTKSGFYVSAFRRALETGAPIQQVFATPAQVWRDLHEVGGCYEGCPPQPRRPCPGLTVQELQREFPWAHPPADWTAGGWNELPRHESVQAARPRADRVADQLVQLLQERPPEHGPLLLVSHGEFIALLVTRLLQLPGDYFVRPRSIYNTAITKLRRVSLRWQLIEFNIVDHLASADLSS